MSNDPQGPALLQAVLADPDNDLPRLVYADWLEENGEPDRAEFIRVQCRLAAMSEVERQSADGLALRMRQYAVQGCIFDMLPEFTDLVQDTVNEQGMWYAFDPGSAIRFCIRRGFIAEVRCSHMAWMAGIGVLVSAAHPVERVHTGAAIVAADGERDDRQLSELLVAWARLQVQRS